MKVLGAVGMAVTIANEIPVRGGSMHVGLASIAVMRFSRTLTEMNPFDLFNTTSRSEESSPELPCPSVSLPSPHPPL